MQRQPPWTLKTLRKPILKVWKQRKKLGTGSLDRRIGILLRQKEPLSAFRNEHCSSDYRCFPTPLYDPKCVSETTTHFQLGIARWTCWPCLASWTSKWAWIWNPTLFNLIPSALALWLQLHQVIDLQILPVEPLIANLLRTYVIQCHRARYP